MKFLNRLKLSTLLIFSTAAIFADNHNPVGSTVTSATVASGTVSGSTMPSQNTVNSTNQSSTTVSGSVMPSTTIKKPELQMTDPTLSGSTKSPSNK